MKQKPRKIIYWQYTNFNFLYTFIPSVYVENDCVQYYIYYKENICFVFCNQTNRKSQFRLMRKMGNEEIKIGHWKFKINIWNAKK